MRLVVCLSLLAALGLPISVLRAEAMDTYLGTRGYEDIYVVPPPSTLAFASLGHRRAAADLVWMRALVYVGDEFRHRGGLSNIFRYAEAIVSLDPRFKRVYHWIAVAGLYQTDETTMAEVEATLSLLRQGLRRFPNDGAMLWDIGTTLQYELVPRLPRGSTERNAAEAEATNLMVEAARRGAGPAWLSILNITRLKAAGETTRAITHLEEMYSQVGDAAVREEIEEQLSQLRGRAQSDAFVQVNEDFVTRWQSRRPWLPDGLFLLLEPPARPADQTAN